MFVRSFSLIKIREARKLVILIVMILFLASCRPAEITFRPPNLNEIKAYIKDQGITWIADKLLDDSIVILYENGTSYGYFILTVQDPGGLQAVNQTSAVKSEEPILILGQLKGDKPFMAVVIQETALLAETAAIEVAIDSQNRLTATTNGKAGVIIWSPSRVNDWRTITLFNAHGKILYRQESQSVQQLRVANIGSKDIQSLTVLFPGLTADAEAARVEFGDVPAGEMTGYRNVPGGVYRYAAYEYIVDRRMVSQSVTDWVGESPMQGEKFTYRIELDSKREPGGQVQLIEVWVDQP